MCEHDITTRIESGFIITFCKKCGKIFDRQPLEKEQERWSEGLRKDNGGQILHD